jgi:hypothetical protein
MEKAAFHARSVHAGQNTLAPEKERAEGVPREPAGPIRKNTGTFAARRVERHIVF